jgi:hypothetical protein
MLLHRCPKPVVTFALWGSLKHAGSSRALHFSRTESSHPTLPERPSRFRQVQGHRERPRNPSSRCTFLPGWPQDHRRRRSSTPDHRSLSESLRSRAFGKTKLVGRSKGSRKEPDKRRTLGRMTIHARLPRGQALRGADSCRERCGKQA